MADEADQIVVVVRRLGEFRWYRSERTLWILDRKKWDQAFIDAGYSVPVSTPADRFGLPVIDRDVADLFLLEMSCFQVPKSQLGSQLASRFSDANSSWDVADLLPVLLVDFDRQHVAGFYPDGVRLEQYVPDGWTSEFEDFLTLYAGEDFPEAEKFWIQDGLNMLSSLNERASLTTSDPSDAWKSFPRRF